MTPQEKAKELISKMNVIHYMKLRGKNKNSKGLPISMYDDQIKQCALIAVDEIMKAPHENQYIELIPSDADDTDWFWDKFDEYWQEVKQEIEKL